jgi:chlorophyll synthase
MDLRAAIGLVRPFTCLAPVLGVACGAVPAHRVAGAPYDVLSVALAALAAAFATGASNAWNQAFDAEIDRANKPDRPIPAGRATRGQALAFGWILAALAVGTAAAVACASARDGATTEAWFPAFVIAGVIGTWVYSAPPLRTKRRTFGANVTIAVPRGFLVPVAGWSVLAAPTSLEPWALGLVPGFFVLGAASTKDFADVEGDRAHGCRTLPVVLGPARAARIVAPFLVFPFLLYPLLSACGAISRPTLVWSGLAAALCTLGALAARALLSDPSRLATERNHPAWRAMYLLMLANQLGVALVFASTEA